MPYIKRGVRGLYNGYIRNITNSLNRRKKLTDISGELNYIITKILLDTNPRRYKDYNSLIGVLECAKLELYRKKIAIYEDIAAAENGEI